MTYLMAKKYFLANYFDGDKNVDSFVSGDTEHEAAAIAVRAIDKMIPKYVEQDTYCEETHKVRCPSCGELIEEDIDIYFCPICGQAIIIKVGDNDE